MGNHCSLFIFLKRTMIKEDFDNILLKQLDQCVITLGSKGIEYASQDRLSNFKFAASLQNTTPREALGGMMAKHIISIYDLIREKDLSELSVWEEKIGDAINYLILLKALVIEEFQTKEENNAKANS